jgi:hypothetical protein
LALRRRIAERIAVPLKRAGVETPILEELPHKAEEITAFYYQAVEQYSHGQLELLHIPAFAHGKAYGETAGLWYRVTFPKPIINADVVAVAEGRKGEIPEVKMPTITIPRVELPTIRDITVPDIALPHVPTSIGRFQCGWAVSGITDGLNDMIIILEEGLTRINETIDKADAAMAEIRKNLRDVYDSIKDFREKLQTTFNTHVTDLEARINTGLGRVLPALYKAWGIPSNMAVTPVHIRNVTSTGFEFQSFGRCTVHWFAIGTR